VIGSAGLRLAGYCQALLDASVPGDDQLVATSVPGTAATEPTRWRALLAEQVPFDAVLAFNDTLALGAMRVLQEAGLRIPRRRGRDRVSTTSTRPCTPCRRCRR
jgi:DNA-binding LacI/PurR family transcriptional regulator